MFPLPNCILKQYNARLLITNIELRLQIESQKVNFPSISSDLFILHHTIVIKLTLSQWLPLLQLQIPQNEQQYRLSLVSKKS